MNIFALLYIIPVGCSYTISALVGIYQAENKTHIAKKQWNIAYLYGIFLVVVSLILVHQHCKQILGSYLNNEAVKVKILSTIPLIFSFVILQSSSGMLNGVIRGLGMQNMAALYTFIGYFLVGLPLSYFFAFKAQSFLNLDQRPLLRTIRGLDGMYLGMNIAALLLNYCYLRIIYTLDWRPHS